MIFAIRKSEATNFQNRIYHKVLPAIRKTGIYKTADILNKLFDSAKSSESIQNLKCVYFFEMSNGTVKIGYTLYNKF